MTPIRCRPLSYVTLALQLYIKQWSRAFLAAVVGRRNRAAAASRNRSFQAMPVRNPDRRPAYRNSSANWPPTAYISEGRPVARRPLLRRLPGPLHRKTLAKPEASGCRGSVEGAKVKGFDDVAPRAAHGLS